MMKVLIADDETIVLDGLKSIIPWKDLGFTICGEATNGEMALTQILKLQPDLVLLDLRMPKLQGMQVIEASIKQGYQGKFIIISGFSDFTYAKTAMKYGVNYYITKPVDEEELEKSVTSVYTEIEKERTNQTTFSEYFKKAKNTILKDIITGEQSYHNLQLSNFHLDSNIYKVILYENYKKDSYHPSYSFAEILRVTNQDNDSFEHIKIGELDAILLKGDFALERFQNLLQHYQKNPQKGSALDSLFLTYGHDVYQLEEIYLSFDEAKHLIKRRFFCKENQHVLGYMDLPSEESLTYRITKSETAYYYQTLTNYIQSFNHQRIVDTLKLLEDRLFLANNEVKEIKYFLTDIFLQIKHTISFTYNDIDIPFPTNAAIIALIEQKYYLYEIIQYFSEQFNIIMNAIGYPSRDNVLDDILYYIDHNYKENLKLETIAPLFGYNSSYLGKFFRKKMGQNFNSYLDELRIKHSKEYLKEKDLKVYMIAKMVGYKNVDYFHKKFKKYVGISPAEYRKKYLCIGERA